MQKKYIQPPPYPIASVDNALRILQILRDQGSVRLTDIATDLGVAVSTAHRLMAMLVYRGFAVQEDSKRYAPSPVLGVGAVSSSWHREVRQVLQPALEALCALFDETANLMVRIGAHVRFLYSVEATAILRVGDRAGSVLPARSTSGGKALLSYQSHDYLGRLYLENVGLAAEHRLSPAEFQELLHELATVRAQGFAVNREESESGVGAIGLVVLEPAGRPIAAFSLSSPISRFDRLCSPDALAHLFQAQQEMTEALREAGLDKPDSR
ncbi:IclR family transcriptional regulator [Nonomuraea sp. K274]|uniref:IclR family transcriptional regulator n=1 Tax=Nonomuraea cypriaca TaxID=1187855 RepID=A0A931A938_9ACTN|nr:IclR family transcriptional regulator [Nonomuraea cypriaca]MBF8186288.1 IclR family transcriptional regulator [Nonomuraea cypriaca]